jgi:hypothetical protein
MAVIKYSVLIEWKYLNIYGTPTLLDDYFANLKKYLLFPS